MRRLSGTDALFLAGDTPSWHQHVGGLVVVDPAGVEGFGYDAIVKTVHERLPLVPKFTWKLREKPLRVDRPVWVDDAAFDIDDHVHRVQVSAPGGPRETAAVVGAILSRKLDRRRPLWDLWYLDGLANGRVGIVMKYHHCLLDGMAGTGLATLLLDLEPSPPPLTIPARPDLMREPNAVELMLHSVPSLVTIPWRATLYGARLARRVVDVARYAVSPRPAPDIETMVRAPRTSINGTIGPERTMAYASVALSDVKALRKHFGVTVNDIVLALCSGAIRGYLEPRGELPKHSLTTGIPVSVRAEGDASYDNQLSYIAVPLATNEADPIARVEAIRDQTSRAKQLHEVLREHPIGSIGDTAPHFVIAGLLRLAYSAHVLSYVPGMMNTLVSNVPGPPMPLYMAGGRVEGIFPTSVILEGMGLNTTAFSYGDRIDFGLHVDPNLVPDPWLVSAGIPAALAELMAAAGLGAPSPVADPFGFTGPAR